VRQRAWFLGILLLALAIAVSAWPQRQSGIAKTKNSDNHPKIQPRNLILIVALIAS